MLRQVIYTNSKYAQAKPQESWKSAWVLTPAGSRKRTEVKSGFENSQSEGAEKNPDSEQAISPAKQVKNMGETKAASARTRIVGKDDADTTKGRS